MKQNKITVSFMFPVLNNVMGGVQNLLINLIPYLVRNNLCKVRLYDYKNGLIYRQIVNNHPLIDVELIDLDGRNLLIPNKGNETFVFFGFQFLRYSLFLENKENVKILNWDVYYPQWSSLNKIYFSLLRGPKLICDLLSRTNSQIFMESIGLSEFIKLGGSLSESNIVNIPVKINKDFIVKVFKRDNSIRIGYIGRAEEWKIFPLVKFVRDLQCNGVDFKLFVITNDSGPFVRALDQFGDICVTYIVGKKVDELKEILHDIDLGFAMGTSALDFARYSIPTILADFGNKAFFENYKYRWLFDATNLGVDIFSSYYDDESRDELYNLIDALRVSYCDIAKRCYMYVKKNHSIENVAEQLMKKINNTKLTPKFVSNPFFLSICVLYFLRNYFRSFKKWAII